MKITPNSASWPETGPVLLVEYNKHHDRQGRFASGPGGGGTSPRKAALRAVTSNRIFTPQEKALPESHVQPFRSKKDAYAKAVPAYRAFVASMDTGRGVDKAIGAVSVIAKDDGWLSRVPDKGLVVVLAPMKSEESAVRKVKTFDGDWSKLTDVVRGSILVDRYSQIPAVLKALRKEMAKGGMTFAERPGNRIASPLGGYEDIALKVRMKNGVSAELLIMAKAVAVVKQGRGHALYEQMRVLRDKPKKTKKDHQELERLAAETAAVYRPATAIAKR